MYFFRDGEAGGCHLSLVFCAMYNKYTCAQILYESCEGELFSMERLLLKLAQNDHIRTDVLSVCLPCLEAIV